MTVLTAPAGYGKTTLLAQAVAANAAAPVGIDCWLTCEPDDQSASSLAEGLLQALAAALHPVDPSGCGAADDAGPIAEAVWRRSPTEVALIVDDVHEIAPGSPAAHLLARVVQHLPANGHLVLAGRGPPPLPLARLELAGLLARLDEHDLAFTVDEQERFASAREVPADRLAACGGWPALAELIATAGPGATADYVGQEVLAGAPARRHRLALLAHLGTVDAEVARAGLGEEVDLDELLAGLPLVATAGDGTRSLHGLWRSLLAHDASAAEVAGARRRAARVLRHRGEAVAAARLLIDAAAWDELAEAIVDVLGAAHPPVPRDVLARWYERLPADARADPGGRLLAAVAAGDTDPVSAARDLDAAAAGFRDRGFPTGELACLVQLGQLAWWSEDRTLLIAVVARVFQLERSGCDAALPLACLGRALVADVQNDSRTVLAELDRIPPGSLNDRWQAIVDWLRSTSSMHLGDARTALSAADAAVAHAGPLHQPLAEGARLQARWFLGEVDAVAGALPALVERTFASGPRNFAAIYASQCCLVDASTGRPERAAEHLARARTAAGTSPAPLVDSHLSLAAAAVAVATGDDERAATILTDYLARHPLAAGHSAAPQQRTLALIYVLAATTRAAWDAADLGPVFAVARELARALVAVRDGAALPADTPRLPDTGIVRAHLPRRWATELAVAAVAAGHADGWRLLEDLWPEARPDVVALARRGPDDTNGRARHTAGITSDAATAPGATGPGTVRAATTRAATTRAATAVRTAMRTAARAALARLAVPPSSHLELRLLGVAELWRDGEPVTAPEWRRERVRSLLAHLALHGTASRAQVADDLWPALDADGQSRNLRVTLTYLLRVLEPERAPRGPSFLVRQDANQLRLHPGGHLDVDVWRFDDLADRARDADRHGSPSAALDHALAAVELWRSDPTELAGEPWAVPLVERRRLRVAGLATRAGELLLAKGAADEARALAERALAVDAWSEEAHRLVVAAHRVAGDDLAARRALARFREALGELGITPDESTLMVERLLDTGSDLATGADGERAAGARSGRAPGRLAGR
jgi:DNA-binding SARP family transcriptional activator